MFNRKKIALAVTTVLLASSSVANAEIASDSATVTVQNAFTLASTTAIDFGTLRVSQPNAQTNLSTYTELSVDGTQTATDGDANASMTVITSGTPGRFDVTGAAPFNNLTITLGAGTATDDMTDGTSLSDADSTNGISGMYGVELTTSGAGANDNFLMYVEVSDTRIEGGSNNGVAYAVSSGVGNLRTDATGAVGLSFGGRLAYNRASTVNPNDGAYTGNYQITVNY
ncbi:MAG: hypothetical protein AAGJ37_03385 [Pseudomonadota bacterium]